MFDMKNLAKLKTLDAGAGEAMKAFWAFDKAAFAEGALSVQQKQLIAVAVALTTPMSLLYRAACECSARRRRDGCSTGGDGHCCCRHSRGRRHHPCDAHVQGLDTGGAAGSAWCSPAARSIINVFSGCA